MLGSHRDVRGGWLQPPFRGALHHQCDGAGARASAKVSGACEVNAFIIQPAVLGILWSAKEWSALSNEKLDGRPDLLAKQGSRAKAAAEDIVAEMIKISYMISQGAMSFLFAEYTYTAVYIVLFSVFLSFFMGVLTTIGCVVGR